MKQLTVKMHDKYWSRCTFNDVTNETKYYCCAATVASQSWQHCRVQKYSV